MQMVDEAVAAAGGQRVVPVAVTGEIQSDVERIRTAADGGAQMAFDMVGAARDPDMTLAVLGSLSREGRLVLMGSTTVPLLIPYTEVMLNSWEIIGQFIYSKDSYRGLLNLMRTGQLDVNVIQPRVFALEALPEAMEAALTGGNLECIVIKNHE
jgi:alcohol dehydrogenase